MNIRVQLQPVGKTLVPADLATARAGARWCWQRSVSRPCAGIDSASVKNG